MTQRTNASRPILAGLLAELDLASMRVPQLTRRPRIIVRPPRRSPSLRNTRPAFASGTRP